MKTAALIFIMAAVTYILRALPITIFHREIKSKWLKSFLYYIPYAVLAAMTFPAIFYSTGSVPPAVLGFVGAVMAAYFGRGLMTTAVIAVLASFAGSFFI